jgi:hypothetical protein
VPDYTDPYLIPYPVEEDFAEGSHHLEEMARSVDSLHAAQAARLTTLSTRPTVIRRRGSNLPISFGSITFDTTDHNNFSAVDFTTPAVGAHPVAGVYPALWRLDAWVHFIPTAATIGAALSFEVELRQALPGESSLQITRVYTTYQRDTNTGGEYLPLSVAVLLDSPGTFTNDFFSGSGAGNVQTGSWMSLTRIRSA